MGTASNLATHTTAASGDDLVITVTFDDETAGTITLTGVANHDHIANLNVKSRALSSDTCEFVY